MSIISNHAVALKFTKNVVCVLVLCCLSYTLQAQRDSSNKFVPKRRIPVATLKFNPAAFVNIFRPALYFSSDVYITNNIVVDFGVGWFFGSIEQRFKKESYNGLRQRLGFKYVFLSDRKVGPYIGIETKFNYIDAQNIEVLSRYGGQYTELALLKKNTQNYGIAIRGGIHVIPGKNRRFILDIYSGFGYRHTSIKMQDIPEDAQQLTFSNAPFWGNDMGTYNLPDFLFGFNLGYCFHRKEISK